MVNISGAYVISEILLRFVFVAAFLTVMNDSIEMVKRVRCKFTSPIKDLIALVARIGDTSICWLVDRFVMPLQVLLVALSFSANRAHKRFVRGLLRMSVNHVALQSLLKHDSFTRRAFDINLDKRVDRLAVVLHVAATLESFFTIFLRADKQLRWVVDSLDMVLEVVRRVGGERTQIALLAFQIQVRELVLTKEKLRQVALRTLITLKSLFFERIFVAMCHCAMFLETNEVAERLLAVLAFMLLPANMVVQMRDQVNLCIQVHSTLVTLKRHIRLLVYVGWSQRGPE